MNVNIARLLHEAKRLSKFYRAEVYLVGSALTKERPRDLDIRVYLGPGVFKRRFGIGDKKFYKEGATGQWSAARYRWSRHCTAVAHSMSVYLKVNVDFQVRPAFDWGLMRLEKHPQMRLWPQ